MEKFEKLQKIENLKTGTINLSEVNKNIKLVDGRQLLIEALEEYIKYLEGIINGSMLYNTSTTSHEIAENQKRYKAIIEELKKL